MKKEISTIGQYLPRKTTSFAQLDVSFTSGTKKTFGHHQNQNRPWGGRGLLNSGREP